MRDNGKPLRALFVLKSRPYWDGFLVENNFYKKDMKIARREAQAETLTSQGELFSQRAVRPFGRASTYGVDV